MKMILKLLCAFLLITAIKNDSLDNVEHVVLFMQENRAFDHYFGSLKGVRGFNDYAHPDLPNGNSIFKQPLNDKYAELNDEEILCGCGSCSIKWKDNADAKIIRGHFKKLTCP